MLKLSIGKIYKMKRRQKKGRCFILPLSCYFFFVMKIAIAITAAATTPPITQ